MFLMSLKLIFTSEASLLWTVWPRTYIWPLMLGHVSPVHDCQHRGGNHQGRVAVVVPYCGVLTELDQLTI